MRSMSSFNRSRSQSTKPLVLDSCFRSASIPDRSWPPSDRRLLTNVSTFLCSDSTVSFISL